MTKDEALHLALEALELVSIEFVCNGAHHAKKDRHEWLDPCPIVDRYKEAITAIKAALEAKDEPVAWAFFFEDGEASNELFDTREQGEKWLLSDDCLWAGSLKPLYTTPPQRTWVGLTDEEIDQGLLRSDYALQTAHAWRAGVVFAMTQLKDKNT